MDSSRVPPTSRVVYLTNRFHVAMRLFSNRSQMTSRTKKWHTRRSRVCHWCSYHILTSSVIYYWTDARQHGIYLFYIITKSLFYFKIFQHNTKAGLLPRLCKRKSHLTWSMIYTKWSKFIVATRSKELWLVDKKCATVKPDSSVAPRWMWEWEQNWIAKSTNLDENARKIKSVFVIRAALWAKKLGRCLENYRTWKNTLRKLVVTVNLEAIWFEFWMKGA